MHTHRMGLNPFLTFYIDTMLNFDGDVDANTNANVKCEHTIRVSAFVFRKVSSLCHFSFSYENHDTHEIFTARNRSCGKVMFS